MLQAVRMDQGSEHGDAENATLFLSPVDTFCSASLRKAMCTLSWAVNKPAQLRSGPAGTSCSTKREAI